MKDFLDTVFGGPVLIVVALGTLVGMSIGLAFLTLLKGGS